MSRITEAALAALAAALALALPGVASAAPTLVPVGTFGQPVHVAAPPRDAGRLFVVEKPGLVRVVRDGDTLPTPFLDVSDEVAADGERGLLSIAFAPDYESSGLFYVYLTAASPAGELQVREYRRSADPDRADEGTRRIVWTQAHPRSNHNGGQLDWGPDGFLWLATGDGGGQGDPDGNAQNTASQLGKVLRIDPRPGNAGPYTVPADNPFGNAVWSTGLRNPFRFSFDHRGTGDLVIGDVGGGTQEEIDWAPFAEGLGRGRNYGWPCREGFGPGPVSCDPGAAYLPPVLDYQQASPRAVTGGVVVRDPGLPTLAGRYLYADFYSGVVHSVRLARPEVTDDRSEGIARENLAAFGEDACGHVHVVSLDGSVDRIQDGAPGPCVLRPTPPPLLAPAPTGPGPVPGPGVVDRTSPRISVRIARKGRVGRRSTPRIQVVATETCRVTISARVAGARLKRVRALLRGGRRYTVRLRPSAKGAKKIRRALARRRRVPMVVSVRAVDAAGNVGRVQRRLRIRR